MPTPRSSSFSLLELMTVAAIVAVLAAIAVPELYERSLRAKQAELPLIVEGLLDAQFAFDAANDHWADCETTQYQPDSNAGRTPRSWASGIFLSCYGRLGFQPDGDLVYGSYTTGAAGGITGWGCDVNADIGPYPGTRPYAYGFSDLDGDGAPAQYLLMAFADANDVSGWCPDAPGPY